MDTIESVIERYSEIYEREMLELDFRHMKTKKEMDKHFMLCNAYDVLGIAFFIMYYLLYKDLVGNSIMVNIIAYVLNALAMISIFIGLMLTLHGISFFRLCTEEEKERVETRARQLISPAELHRLLSAEGTPSSTIEKVKSAIEADKALFSDEI